MTASALYAGKVAHRRFRPVKHLLRYTLFWMLLDLDEAPQLNRRLRLFSLNRFNLFSHWDRDHLDGSETPLRRQIDMHLRGAGIETGGGPVRLLCMPRILGHVFNPLSLFFCHFPDGRLAAILYEVNNTFGQRHSYLIPASGEQAGETVRHGCAKRFHVSPFMDMAMTYDFRVTAPDVRQQVIIHGRDAGGLMLTASFVGERRPLNDAEILKAFSAFPFLTLKVVAAIHWEALKLWLKGVRLRALPPAPAEPLTFTPLPTAPLAETSVPGSQNHVS